MRHRALLAGLLALLLPAPGAVHSAGCDAAAVTELGRHFRVRGEAPVRDLALTGEITALRHGAGDGDIRYLRLLVVKTGEGGPRWGLALRDRDMKVLQWMGPEDFSDRPARWSRRIAEKEVVLTLHGTGPGGDLDIRVPQYFAMPEQARSPFYSTQTRDPAWVALHDPGVPTARRLAGDSVGMALISHEEGVSACSGVAVGPDLFLTNWHCSGGPTAFMSRLLWTEKVCPETLIDFSWDGDDWSNDFLCTAVLAIDPALDYALLRIAPLSDRAAVLPARIEPARLSPGEQVTLIHHPLALPKQISRNCPLGPDLSREGWKGGGETEFEHLCDTEGGSSGAPVFDAQGRLRGLHHLGFQRDPVTCLPTERVNRAVWIDAILADLATKGIALPPTRP